MEGTCLPVADLSEVDLGAEPSSGEEYLAFVRMEAAKFKSVQRAPPQKPPSKQTVFSQHKDVEECPFEYRALPAFRAKLHDWFMALRAGYSSNKQAQQQLALDSELASTAKASRTAALPRASNHAAWGRILTGVADGGNSAMLPLLPLLHELSHAQLCALFTTWADVVQPLPDLPGPALTWLFAFMAAVEMPVDGDTMCALRRLVLLLCKRRAALVQRDAQVDGDSLHRINVLLCILGSVFGQFGISEG
jgi:hypothetical protein